MGGGWSQEREHNIIIVSHTNSSFAINEKTCDDSKYRSPSLSILHNGSLEQKMFGHVPHFVQLSIFGLERLNPGQ